MTHQDTGVGWPEEHHPAKPEPSPEPSPQPEPLSEPSAEPVEWDVDAAGDAAGGAEPPLGKAAPAPPRPPRISVAGAATGPLPGLPRFAFGVQLRTRARAEQHPPSAPPGGPGR